MGKRKRSNGEGTIYRRKNGSFCAQTVIDGKRVSGYGKTQTAARENLNKNIKKALSSGTVLPAKSLNMELGDYVKHFIAALPFISTNTQKHYQHLTNLITKYVGTIKVKNVSKDTILTLGIALKTEGYTRGTILVACRFLHRVAKKLRTEGYTTNDVSFSARDLRLPKQVKYVLPPLDEVVSQINKITKFPLKEMALFCLYTGLRRGELLGLQWDDINLTTSTLSVKRAVGLGMDNQIILTSPKNKNIGQTVFMPDEALKILKSVKKRQRQLGITSQFIFCDDKGEVMCPNNVSGYYKNIFKSITPHGAIHILRHLNATVLAKNNIPLRTISMQLRHSSIDTTAAYINRIVDEEFNDVKSVTI